MDDTNRLIPAPAARREWFGGISSMTEWRWREAGILPEPIRINRRNFYRASDLVAVQKRLAEATSDTAVAVVPGFIQRGRAR